MATNRVTTLFDFKSNNGLKKIKADVKEADGLFGKFKTSIKSSWQELNRSKSAQLAVGAGAAALAVKSVQAASDMEESINAVNVAYGDAAGAVHALGDESVNSFGMSKRAFNEFAVQFSAFAQQIAEGSGRSPADVVQEMATRVADFASVYNLSMGRRRRSPSPRWLVRQRRSVGSVVTCRRRLSRRTRGRTASQSRARNSPRTRRCWRDTARSWSRRPRRKGDFANTSDSLANQQRKLEAQLENTAAEIGENLIPVAAKLAETMNKTVVPAISGTLGALDALFEGAERTGAHIADVMFGGDRLDNRNFVDAVNRAEMEAAKFDRTLLDGVSTFAEARSVALEHADAIGLGEQATHMANLVALDYQRSVLDVAEAEHERAAAVSDLNKWVAKATHLEEQYTAATEAKARRDDEAAEAAERHKQKLDDLIASINESIDSTFSYEKSNIDLTQQVASLAAQEAETAAVLSSSSATAAEKEAALLKLREAEIATAEQAWETAQAFAEEQGASAGSREAAELQKAELQRLADKFPLLRDEIDLYIAKLNSIPSTRHTSITTSYSQGGGTGHRGVRHTGGRVSPGEERHVLPGESFVPDVPGRVDSREDTRRAVQRNTAPTRNGPLLNIEQAHFHNGTDADAFAAALNARLRL